MEYARSEMNQNRMSKFLKGLKLEDLFFVGIQESFDEDLRDLFERLGWKNAGSFHQNSSQHEKSFVSQNEREEIKRLNLSDVALYQEAVALRDQRIKTIMQK